MRDRLPKLQAQLARAVDEQKSLHSDLKKLTEELKHQELQAKADEAARTIIQDAAKYIQEQMQYRLSELVTLTIASVFPEPYEFNIEFDIKRNRTEAFPTLTRPDSGEALSLKDEVGVGIVDVASFGMRMSVLSLQSGLRPVLVLDEPFKFVSKDLQQQVAEMVREICEKTGTQIIIITHDSAMEAVAHKSFRLKLDSHGITQTEERSPS